MEKVDLLEFISSALSFAQVLLLPTPTKMTGRRSLFKAQLNDLKQDISSLTEKMEKKEPAPLNFHSDATNLNENSVNSVASTPGSGGNSSLHHISAEFARMSDKLDTSLRSSGGSPASAAHAASSYLQSQLQVVSKERDELKASLSACKAEVLELRREVAGGARFRMQYEHQEQDMDAMRISLDSSERIRKQQKALIALIQRSQNVRVYTACVCVCVRVCECVSMPSLFTHTNPLLAL